MDGLNRQERLGAEAGAGWRVGCGPGAPILLRCDDPPGVSVGVLADGVAARMLRLYGERQIRVSSSVPVRSRGAAARHLLTAHADECSVDDCSSARGWLSRAVLLTIVGAVSA